MNRDGDGAAEPSSQPPHPLKNRWKKAGSKVITSTRVVRAFSTKKINLKFPNGDRYAGDFDTSKARFHGRGEFFWANGSRYSGDWFNGKRQGEGKLWDKPNKKFDDKQSCYVGEFRNNKREGKGRFTRYDGAVYDGPWKDDVMDGKRGTFTYPNGDQFIGDWRKGMKHGRGEYIYSRPAAYSSGGTLLPFRLIQSAKYRGDFVEGLSSGEGESLNDAGDRYYGAWQGGERSGRGAYQWKSDGRVYRGEWSGDKANGIGLLTRRPPEEEEEEERGNDDGKDNAAEALPNVFETVHSNGEPETAAAAVAVAPAAAPAGSVYEILLPGNTLRAARSQAVTGGEVVVYEGPFKNGLQHGRSGREVELVDAQADAENEWEDGDASIGSLAPLVVNAPHAKNRSGGTSTEASGEQGGEAKSVDDRNGDDDHDHDHDHDEGISVDLSVEDSEGVLVPGHARAVYTGPFFDGVRDSYGGAIAYGRVKEANGSLYVGKLLYLFIYLSFIYIYLFIYLFAIYLLFVYHYYIFIINQSINQPTNQSIRLGSQRHAPRHTWRPMGCEHGG